MTAIDTSFTLEFVVSTDDVASTDASSCLSKELLKNAIQAHGIDVVRKAYVSFKNVRKINVHYVPNDELFKIILFIETDFKKAVKINDYRANVCGCPIEFEPESKRTFIHLMRFDEARLGTGAFKNVSHSINYDSQTPELVANNVYKWGTGKEKEVEILKIVNGFPGLIQTLAFTKLYHPGEKPTLGFITRLYNQGSLEPYIEGRKPISNKEIISIARDLILGLKSFHSKGFYHRDLHAGNILLDEKLDPNTKIRTLSSVLIDFGRASKVRKTKKGHPQVRKELNPPEAFLTDTQSADPRLSDIYALGCNLFSLMNHETAPWIRKFQHDFKTLDCMDQNMQNIFGKSLANCINEHIQLTLRGITKGKHSKDPYNKYILLVLKMLSTDYKKRPSAAMLLPKIERILKQFGK